MAVLHRFQLVIVCCYFSYNYPRKYFTLVPNNSSNNNNTKYTKRRSRPRRPSIMEVETSEGRVEKH